MPKQLKDARVPYDTLAWRKRCDLTQGQAATMLGISTSKLWRIDKEGKAAKEMIWACYGIERYIYDQKSNRLPIQP